jgi:metal-responsive CopG/Arc/MetJ family transcriptional regulator
MTNQTTVRSVSFDQETLNKANLIVKKRLIRGVTNRSGLIDYALREVFDKVLPTQPQLATNCSEAS